ncbi:MAG: diaminopimelate dehydrogenase, partial [Oscillospiraceae bacterium]
MCKIRVGIVGYGNLGRGVEKNIKCNPDFELVGIFTRRQPETVVLSDKNIKAYKIEDAYNMKEKIDVMILCGGSATDLPEQSPDLAEHFNTVDSFDTHAKIPGFLAKVDAAAKKGGNVSAISIGWDPGMFSLNRLYMSAVLPQGNTYTFWGKGVSQGHSDAIRRIEGVENAIQYTIPVEEVIDEIRAGGGRDYTTREKHKRECFVVAKSGADTAKIENEIKNMPNYFSDYDTMVHFISAEELK